MEEVSSQPVPLGLVPETNIGLRRIPAAIGHDPSRKFVSSLRSATWFNDGISHTGIGHRIPFNPKVLESHMDDLNYLFKRQQQERSNAERALSDDARRAHAELAGFYENRIHRLTQGRIGFSPL